GLDVLVEGAAHRHVRERVGLRVEQRPAASEHDYLGQLPAGNVVAGAEGAVSVARDDAVLHGRLDVLVESVGGRYICERGLRGVGERPALTEHHYLGNLAAGGEVVRAEGTVPVAGDDAM